ncbi:HTH domain-containing protein [Streptomyces sp. NPDC026665]|uniref:HTH domain-containing protein n=1 Tax=Streptomyces sp. NPDC026665 TaxID=3154798 RepID=UPI0033E33BF4
MTPASARSVRRQRVRRLAQAEPDLSHREIGKRLGISKDTVRRDLERDEQDEQDGAAQAEPQVTKGGAGAGEPDGAVCAAGEPGGAEPDAHSAPRPALPQRMAQTAGAGGAFDVSRMPALRRDLALLAQTGRSVDALVHQAVTSLAFGYRLALSRGDVKPNSPFIVRDVRMVTAVLPERPSVPAPGTE